MPQKSYTSTTSLTATRTSTTLSLSLSYIKTHLSHPLSLFTSIRRIRKGVYLSNRTFCSHEKNVDTAAPFTFLCFAQLKKPETASGTVSFAEFDSKYVFFGLRANYPLATDRSLLGRTMIYNPQRKEKPKCLLLL